VQNRCSMYSLLEAIVYASLNHGGDILQVQIEGEAYPFTAAMVDFSRGSEGLPKHGFEVYDEGTQAVAPEDAKHRSGRPSGARRRAWQDAERAGHRHRGLHSGLFHRGRKADWLPKLQTLVLKGTNSTKMKFKHEVLPALKDLQLQGCAHQAARMSWCLCPAPGSGQNCTVYPITEDLQRPIVCACVSCCVPATPRFDCQPHGRQRRRSHVAVACRFEQPWETLTCPR
jgi:hypothetical protein